MPSILNSYIPNLLYPTTHNDYQHIPMMIMKDNRVMVQLCLPPVSSRLTPKTTVAIIIIMINKKITPPMTPPTIAPVLSAGEGEEIPLFANGS